MRKQPEKLNASTFYYFYDNIGYSVQIFLKNGCQINLPPFFLPLLSRLEAAEAEYGVSSFNQLFATHFLSNLKSFTLIGSKPVNYAAMG